MCSSYKLQKAQENLKKNCARCKWEVQYFSADRIFWMIIASLRFRKDITPNFWRIHCKFRMQFQLDYNFISLTNNHVKRLKLIVWLLYNLGLWPGFCCYHELYKGTLIGTISNLCRMYLQDSNYTCRWHCACFIEIAIYWDRCPKSHDMDLLQICCCECVFNAEHQHMDDNLSGQICPISGKLVHVHVSWNPKSTSCGELFSSEKLNVGLLLLYENWKVFLSTLYDGHILDDS